MKLNKSAIIICIFVILAIVLAVFLWNKHQKLNTYTKWTESEVSKIPKSSNLKISYKVPFYKIDNLSCEDVLRGTFRTDLTNAELLEFYVKNKYRAIEPYDGKIRYASDYPPSLPIVLPLVFEPVSGDGTVEFRLVHC